MTFSLSLSLFYVGRRCSSARPRRTPASRNCSRHCSPSPAFCPPAAAAPAREVVQPVLRQRPAVSSDAHLPMSAHRPVAVSTIQQQQQHNVNLWIFRRKYGRWRAGKGRTDYSKCKCKERRARLALASSTSLWAGSVLVRSRKKGILWDKMPCKYDEKNIYKQYTYKLKCRAPSHLVKSDKKYLF